MLLIVSKVFNFVDVMSELVMTPQERSVIDRITMPIGTVFRSNGVYLKCVEASYVELPRDACSGCYYSQNYLTCPRSQCSAFGRTDGMNVWFVEVSAEEYVEYSKRNNHK